MEKRELKRGELLQINPEHETYGGQLIMCEEPKNWGCQGVLFTEHEYQGLTRYKGRAFIRIKFEEMEPVGFMEWIWESTED